jgi:hypothetical protein
MMYRTHCAAGLRDHGGSDVPRTVATMEIWAATIKTIGVMRLLSGGHQSRSRAAARRRRRVPAQEVRERV